MLTMIKSDLVTMKNYALQNLAIMLIVAIFICIGTGTLIAGILAVVAMLPFTYIFSIVAYDEMNGWERFRLTLPISRNQVVLGRYGSALIVIVATVALMMACAAVMLAVLSGIPQAQDLAAFYEGASLPAIFGYALLTAAVLLVASTFAFPLFLRFGLTKATRVVPIVVMIVLLIGMFVVGNFDEGIAQLLPALQVLLDPAPGQEATSLLYCALVFAIALVPYGISAFIATKLYAKREF